MGAEPRSWFPKLHRADLAMGGKTAACRHRTNSLRYWDVEHCRSQDLTRWPQASRRSVLRVATASAIGLALGRTAVAKETKTPPKPQNVLSPDAVLQRLMKGNER
jgi:hypothetical protein